MDEALRTYYLSELKRLHDMYPIGPGQAFTRNASAMDFWTFMTHGDLPRAELGILSNLTVATWWSNRIDPTGKRLNADCSLTFLSDMEVRCEARYPDDYIDDIVMLSDYGKDVLADRVRRVYEYPGRFEPKVERKQCWREGCYKPVCTSYSNLCERHSIEAWIWEDQDAIRMEFEGRCEAFLKLAADWDSYNGGPIDPRSIATARRLFEALLGVWPDLRPFFAPSAAGVGFEYTNPSLWDFAVDVSGDGASFEYLVTDYTNGFDGKESEGMVYSIPDIIKLVKPLPYYPRIWRGEHV